MLELNRILEGLILTSHFTDEEHILPWGGGLTLLRFTYSKVSNQLSLGPFLPRLQSITLSPFGLE